MDYTQELDCVSNAAEQTGFANEDGQNYLLLSLILFVWPSNLRCRDIVVVGRV